jgi:hypothetical protein
MQKPKICIFILMALSIMLILSCGSSGDGNQGNTVYITADSKNNSTFTISTTAISSTGPPIVYNTGSLDYTISSKIYPNTTGITASAVKITHAEISYTPLMASDGLTMSPAIASWSKGIGPSLVAPGSTTDITLTVVDVPQMIALVKEAAFNDTIQFRYGLHVRFFGTEINSNTSLVCDPTDNNFYVTKGP